MKIVVIDGQGGGVGRAIIEQLRKKWPEQRIAAIGLNALATAAMLRAGADVGASGENAVRVNCRDADIILGPIGIAVADALMGEVSPDMAAAVGASPALKVLVPVGKCRVRIAGIAGQLSLAEAVEEAAEIVQMAMEESIHGAAND